MMNSGGVLTVERGGKPLHVAIVEQIVAAVDRGELGVGERLPPERELAASLGVSRMTARQALGELARTGVVKRVVGRGGGTFILGRGALVGGTTLSAALRREGRMSGVEVVSVEVNQARRRAAAALELGRSDPIVVVVRLVLARGKPLAVERIALPSRLFSDLEDLDLAGDLSELMATFGHAPATFSETLETAPARPSDARMLGVRSGAPLLLVERVGYAADGTRVEFARDRFRGDRTRYVKRSDREDGAPQRGR